MRMYWTYLELWTTGYSGSCLAALRNGQTKECILRLEEMVIQGRELSQFVADFIWLFAESPDLKDGG